MNLSQIIELQNEEEVDIEPRLRTEEARVLRIVEALGQVEQTTAWSTLKNEVFDNVVNVLEKDIMNEAKKDDTDPKKLNRLSGELKWAQKYSDLSKLSNTYKLELQRIRLKLYGKSD